MDAGSALYIANVNNYYYKWNSCKSLSNSRTYTTTNNNQICGAAGQNACQAQYFFGCATFNSFGSLAFTTLDVSISDFNASRTGSKVTLSWSLSEGMLNSFSRIEHSSYAVHFSPLTTMEADSREGVYSYSDFSPVAGENDYRISLINPDGKSVIQKSFPLINLLQVPKRPSSRIRRVADSFLYKCPPLKLRYSACMIWTDNYFI